MSATSQRPYMELAEFAPMFGYKPNSAKNKIGEGTFPIRTYKLGRRIVADKAVVEAWFEMKRREGLAALGGSTRG